MLRVTSQNTSQRSVGLNIQAFFRDLVMAHADMHHPQAQALADMFAQKVQESEWLELSNGLTFEKKFDPAPEQQPNSWMNDIEVQAPGTAPGL